MLDRNRTRWIGMMLLGLFCAPAVRGADEPVIQFNRDIRPILSDKCFLCHGPDKTTRKGKFRLDERESAIGKSAIVPGKPDESGIVKRIFTSDPDDVMPPADMHKQLTANQKELLKKWIAQGAVYQPHWAYVPPIKSIAPKVTQADWAKSPVDAFILRELEAKKIKPSAPADKRTLLRRLSLDLTGLPPTPAEMDAFIKDNAPDAFEKQVDRLLASPRYGERMAVLWLDAARFTDTVGFHGDQNQRIFPYRDYVIEAFNKNKPFDQFTIEQLAGDLLPNATDEQKVATGFNRLNMMTREGGAQPKEYISKYNADRVRTVSTTFLGSTFTCAECHDHKYDPISARDFYALGAFFADVKQWGVYNDYVYTPNADLKGWSNDHPFPPEIQVENAYLKKRAEKLRGNLRDLASAQLKDVAQAKNFAAWQKMAVQFLKDHPTGWLTPSVAVVAGKPSKDDAEMTVTPDGLLLVAGKVKKGAEHAVSLEIPTGLPVAVIKLDLLPHEKNKGNITRDGVKSTTVSLSAAIRGKDGKDTKAAIHFADAEFKESKFANGHEVLGVMTSWKTPAAKVKMAQSAYALLDKPISLKVGEKLIITIKCDNLGAARLSVSPIASENPLDNRAAKLSHASNDELPAAWVMSGAASAESFAQYKTIHREMIQTQGGKAWTMVTEAWDPKVMRVLPRGDWLNETGEIVQPSTPHFLPQPANPDGRRLTRLDLAKWLVSEQNPLTARTIVNRFWKQFFGNGLSAVIDDLGAQGESPSHPDLLDWFAVDYRENGWDTKRLIKQMVMSATYQQSASLRPELRDIDPANRLLASQNPRRLDAEFIRDNALFIAGLLNEDVGGPSAFPYQPAGYYVNIQFPNRDWSPSADARQYRRGLYTHWQRTFLHPMLANFDAPSREECCANRSTSNTPQQALTLLNDPSFVEASRALAAAILKSAKVDADRLESLYQQALGRPIKVKERDSLTQFLAVQRTYYSANPADAKKLLGIGGLAQSADADQPELAAWTTVCRVVLNLHETITRY